MSFIINVFSKSSSPHMIELREEGNKKNKIIFFPGI